MIEELKKYNPYVEMIGMCKFRQNIMHVKLDILPDTEYRVKDLIRDIELLNIKKMKLYDPVREEIGKITGIKYSDVETHRLTFIYSMVY